MQFCMFSFIFKVYYTLRSASIHLEKYCHIHYNMVYMSEKRGIEKMNLFHHVFSSHPVRMFVVICLLLSLTVACTAQEAAPYSYEWFMQPDDSAPTQACVRVFSHNSPALLTNDHAFDAEYVRKIQMIIQETAGIPFTIDKVTEVTFGVDNVVLAANDYIGDEVLMLMPSRTVTKDYSLGFLVHMILSSGETAFGVAVEGKDERGNALTFTGLVPLSYEVNEVLTRTHFTCGAAQEAGKPFIAITTAESPIPQVYNPVFAGDYGWDYFYSIENVTDEPFTVSRIVEAFLIGENVVHFTEYGTAQFDDWGVSREFVTGDPFCGGSGANVQQGFDELGLLVEGTDKDGNALTFAALIPFSKERPQE